MPESKENSIQSDAVVTAPDNEVALQNTAATPVQQPLPLAFINGEAVIEKPEDLFIPPDALEVILETFEGPSIYCCI